MKPVLLIYPPFENKGIQKSRIPFPIGPLYLSAYLKSKGIESKVIDFGYPHKMCKTDKPNTWDLNSGRFFRYGWEDEDVLSWLEKNLKKYHDIVGVSSLMSSTYTGAYRVIEMIKAIDPNKVIVVGGPHATAYPEHVFKNTSADYICIGEGEEQFYKFIKGHTTEMVSIYPRGTKKFKSNPVIDMNELPFWEQNMLLPKRDLEEMVVTFSRGCPFNCSFCGSRVVQGSKWRHKSVSRCIEELRYYNNWGITKFVVEDDNLAPGKVGIKWLKDLCEAIIHENMKIKLTIPHGIPVNALADEELCDLLWDAGFRKMALPLESTNEKVLKDMNKKFTVTHFTQAIKNWSKHEKNPPAQIILGYPFVDTIRSMLQTMIDISNNGGRIWASHFRLNKGIELYDRCLETGYIDKDYDPINSQYFYVETERFDIEDLIELMQISRGLNYGLERGVNIFDMELPTIGKEFYEFNPKVRVGSTIAKGNFSFNRSQTVFAGLLLLLHGNQTTQPIIKKVNNDQLIFNGYKPFSNVYRTLKEMVTGNKVKTINDYL